MSKRVLSRWRKRRLSAAIRFAPTSAAAQSRNGATASAAQTLDTFSIANAEPTRCSEESTCFVISRTIRHSLLLPQKQIKRPTPRHMRSRLSAMAQDFMIVAPGIVQGIGQFRHSVEGSVIVHRLGQLYHRGRQHREIEGDRAKRVTKDV